MITALRLLSIMMVLQTGAAFQPSANTKHIVLLVDERRELPGLAALNADFLRSLKSGSASPLEIYTEEMDLSRRIFGITFAKNTRVRKSMLSSPPWGQLWIFW